MGASASPQLAAGRLNPYGFRRFPEDRREPWHGRCHGDLCAMDTGNPIRIASREACCRAAVILRPACFSPEQPRALWRGVGCRASPCQTCEPRGPSPSGGNFTASLLSREPPRALWRGVGCRASPCQTREPRGPSPSGGSFAAKLHVPRAPLRACGAQSGVQGGERKRVPSGHNRRRRLATGSRQPKRGFGTAVPKTTIEVAGHCPLLSRRSPARWCCTRRKPSGRNRRPLPCR